MVEHILEEGFINSGLRRVLYRLGTSAVLIYKTFKGAFENREIAIFQCNLYRDFVVVADKGNLKALSCELGALTLAQYFHESFVQRAKSQAIKLPGKL